jgi:pimeloyl-ACP methyl ester carboxylesterase
MIVIGHFGFDTDLPERYVSLAIALLLGTASFAALGIGLSGLVRSAEGASAVVNAIYLPVSFISGAFFSPESFPAFLEAIANVLPLTYFIELVRDVRPDLIITHSTGDYMSDHDETSKLVFDCSFHATLPLLDGYGIERAHIVGMSMGGALAQVVALKHPERVATITAISTTKLDSDPAAARAEQLVDGGETITTIA